MPWQYRHRAETEIPRYDRSESISGCRNMRPSLFLAILLAPVASAIANPWSTFRSPAETPPRVIGGYAAGCVAGAERLESRGDGFQTMRRARNRHFGHPRLIAFTRELAVTARRHGATLLVGDMAQARGGPMPSGHRSHQTGLDADYWLMPGPARALTLEETEQTGAPSMVDAVAGAVHDERWGRYQRDMLYAAARHPQVARIFVNPVIKLHLCRTESDTAWLHRLRPWWGHDAHFHVRLHCPEDSPMCEPQAPIPAGDGCDPDLVKWVEEQRQAALAPQRPAPPPAPREVELPAACHALLE